MTTLLDHFRSRLDGGHKLLVPYLMAGVPDRASFPAAYDAVQEHADAVEIGLPFSDPLMDGPVIAAASERAIRNGVGPLQAVELAGELAGDRLRVVMTYYNPIHRIGEEAFCKRLVAAGISGLIVPDLPFEESRSLRDAAGSMDLAWIPLVAPTSSQDRVDRIVATATGFVYAVSTLGVTGTRAALSERAAKVVASCREASDLPVLVGIGVSNAAQAAAAAETADGVVVGSAVVRTLAEQGTDATRALLAELRSVL